MGVTVDLRNAACPHTSPHATSHTESLWRCPAAPGLLPGSPHSRLVRHLEGRAA